MARVAPVYAAAVNKRLAQYGLRYDDLYDPLQSEVGGARSCSL